MADINSLDDILNSDTFGILDKQDEEAGEVEDKDTDSKNTEDTHEHGNSG